MNLTLRVRSLTESFFVEILLKTEYCGQPFRYDGSVPYVYLKIPKVLVELFFRIPPGGCS